MSHKPRFVALTQRVRQLYPRLGDPARAISDRLVRVDGIIVTNPRSRISRAAVVTVAPAPARPRGARKLTAGLDAFTVPVAGRVALDVGASTGGFTHALLAAGARRVYAVDAGYGQLLGSLRLDDRVVNLERTNLGVLSAALVPDVIEVVTIDLSYLALARAAPRLEAVAIAATAELIALVKPMYELGLAHPPDEPDLQAKAVKLAAAAFEETGWHAPGWIRSPLTGRRGSVEYLLHVQRCQP